MERLCKFNPERVDQVWKELRPSGKETVIFGSCLYATVGKHIGVGRFRILGGQG